MEDLDKMFDEILTYLKNKNLRVFPGKPVLAEGGTSVVTWDDESDDWKSFIEIARDEGAKYVIVSKEKGEGEHANDIGSITLAWIKDGLVYIFNKRANWWEEKQVIEEEAPELRPYISISYGEVPKRVREEFGKKTVEELVEELVQFASKEFPGEFDRLSFSEVSRLFWQRKGLPYGYADDPEVSIKIHRVDMLARQRLEQAKSSELLKKSDEELVNEVLDFVKKQFGETPPPNRAIDLFWESKGVRPYAADPTMRLKINRVESLVRQRLEEERIKHEKEILPRLVEECVKWAIGHALRKVTKSNVDYFLSEKGVQLSRMSRDALYNQVNLKLGRGGPDIGIQESSWRANRAH